MWQLRYFSRNTHKIPFSGRRLLRTIYHKSSFLSIEQLFIIGYRLIFQPIHTSFPYLQPPWNRSFSYHLYPDIVPDLQYFSRRTRSVFVYSDWNRTLESSAQQCFQVYAFVDTYRLYLKRYLPNLIFFKNLPPTSFIVISTCQQGKTLAKKWMLLIQTTSPTT